jgi:hypothetical protein
METKQTTRLHWFHFTAIKDDENVHEQIPAMSLPEAVGELERMNYHDISIWPVSDIDDMTTSVTPAALSLFIKAVSELPNNMSMLNKCAQIYEDIENGKYPDDDTTNSLMNFVQDMAALIEGDDR